MTFKSIASFISAVLLSSVVQAQTYVRPSKGKPIVLLNAPVTGALGPAFAKPSTCTVSNVVTGCTLSCPTASTKCYSAAFDMSSFSGLNVTIDRVDDVGGMCRDGLVTSIYVGADPAGSNAQAAQARNGVRHSVDDDVWYVATSAPYAYVRLESYVNPMSGTVPCTRNVTVTITPVPFDPVGVSATTEFAYRVVDVADTCEEITLYGRTPAARLQNLGPNTIKCAVQALSCVPAYPGCPLPPAYPIFLKPDSGIATTLGDGGVLDLIGFQGNLYCCSTTPIASQLGVFQH